MHMELPLPPTQSKYSGQPCRQAEHYYPRSLSEARMGNRIHKLIRSPIYVPCIAQDSMEDMHGSQEIVLNQCKGVAAVKGQGTWST